MNISFSFGISYLSQTYHPGDNYQPLVSAIH